MATFDIKAPMHWNELTLKQLDIVAWLFQLNLDRETLLMTAFCTLAGIKIRHDIHGLRFVSGKNVFKLEPYQLSDFCNRMSWLIDEKPVDIVNPTKINGHLIDVNFGSYFYADTMMGRFDSTGKVLYVRKALRELGCRTWFLSAKKAVAIRLWWNGVQGYLQNLYPNVFPQGQSDGRAVSPFNTLQNLLLMLNDNKPQENKLIEDADAHGVLAAMNNKIEQYEKLKEDMKK